MQKAHLYVSNISLNNKKVEIQDQEQIHYLKDVLRLKPCCKVTFFDGKGNVYLSRLLEISSSKVICYIEKEEKNPYFSPAIAVAFALIKKIKTMDDLIDKLTQLGVARIIPMFTHNVVLKWDITKINKHRLRWEKISLNAAQQAKRAFLPQVEAVKNFNEVIQQEASLKIIFTLREKAQPLKKIIENNNNFKNILILIGPEGDFTPLEIKMAKEKGAVPSSLGDLVLRTETAILAATSFVRLYAKD